MCGNSDGGVGSGGGVVGGVGVGDVGGGIPHSRVVGADPHERVVGVGLPQPASMHQYETWMKQAIELAAATPPEDVPVAALVIDPEGQVIGAGVNRREANSDPTAHAEVLAIRQAAAQHGDGWRLEDCTLVVTLEPCVMCAGTAVMARMGRIVFGAWSPKTGACGSIADVVREPRHPFVPRVIAGVLADECATLLPDFFHPHR